MTASNCLDLSEMAANELVRSMGLQESDWLQFEISGRVCGCRVFVKFCSSTQVSACV